MKLLTVISKLENVPFKFIILLVSVTLFGSLRFIANVYESDILFGMN